MLSNERIISRSPKTQSALKKLTSAGHGNPIGYPPELTSGLSNQSHRPVGLDSGLAKLRHRGGASSLLGWNVYTHIRNKQKELLGTVTEVVRSPSGQALESGRLTSSLLIRTTRDSLLEPYGFKGQEFHSIPLVPSFVEVMHFDEKEIIVKLPKGFVALGRRSLYLDFLSKELLDISSTLKPSIGNRQQGIRVMPTRQFLEKTGRKDIVDIIIHNGGFSEIAEELGLYYRRRKRPLYYWEDPENLDNEIHAFIEDQWVELEQPDTGKPYLFNLVSKEITSKRKAPGRGSAQRKVRIMPSKSMILSVGRYDLHYAIVRNGGYMEVGELLDRSPPRCGPEPIISSLDELLEEIHTFVKEQTAQENTSKLSEPVACRDKDLHTKGQRSNPISNSETLYFPTEAQLELAGRGDLVSAINRFGGSTAVAKQSGLQTHRRPRSYWRSLENVVKEMSEFVSDQSKRLQEQGIRMKGEDPAMMKRDHDDSDAQTNVSLIEEIRRSRYLPTHQQLKAAGRLDLLYAVRLHGHEKVASSCGMKVQKQGLLKSKVNKAMLSQVLRAGPCRLGDIHRCLWEDHHVSFTITNLAAMLAKKVRQGLLVKVAFGTYALADNTDND